jgi:membrane-bound lytic murein transglycosylase B
VRRAAAACAAAVAGLLAPLAAPAPVAAQGGVDGLSPEVAAVPASSPGLDRAEAERDRVAARLRRDVADLADTVAALEAATTERTATAGLLARRDGQLAKTRARADLLRTDLRALAMEWFVTGFGAAAAMDPALDGDAVADVDHRRVLAESAAADTLDDVAFVTARERELAADSARLAERAAVLDARLAELGGRRDRLDAAVRRGGEERALAEVAVAEERLNATVDGTDLSTLALDAYWRAAARLAGDSPSCGVRWWHLAGIGRTESRHGTYRGTRLGVDGRVSEPILGPPLDGSNGFAVVADSDGGLLDGTASTDRAVGPMQFLPSTWRAMGRDATGDGVADPQNIYDAALAAGLYLCRSGPLVDEAALRRAYLTYNRSLVYVDTVLGHAGGYRESVPLS